MAPFPQAYHCISSDPKAEALYIAYGGMFSALRGAKYLLRPHAINVTQPAVANVYELPHAPVRFLSCRRYLLSATCYLFHCLPTRVDGFHFGCVVLRRCIQPQGLATLWAVMLGGNQSTGVLSVAYLPAATTHRFEVMHPGVHAWKPLPPAAVQLAGGGGTAKLALPLERGCALVRLVLG
jgi:hypothetical protein